MNAPMTDLLKRLHKQEKKGKLANRALQKYMHEFHANRDHAMCNIQNRSIPAVQLTHHRILSNWIIAIRNFRALVFLKAHSHAKCFSAKWQHDN
jgi:hypothetical protein